MLEVINAVVYGGLMVVAILFWRRRRSDASAWLAATFTALGLAVVQGAIVPAVDPADLPLPQYSPREVYVDVVVIVLLAFPWLLHRFARALQPQPRWAGWGADLGMAAVVVSVAIAPSFPAPADYTPGWQAFQLALIGWWGVLLGSVSWILWRAGRGEPGVVRSRVRLMAVAAVFMNAALLVGLLDDAEGNANATVQLVTQLLGWASTGAFLLAFEPPAGLRRLWREQEEAALRTAEGGLVRARTPVEAATAVVDAAAALVGGQGAEVRRADGVVLATSTPDPRRRPSRVEPERIGEVEVRGQHSTVLVHGSPLSPVFSEHEEALLAQLCGHLDLAMDRIEAFQASERARVRAERATEELTKLVYGVSHDLRNPLVTVLGFVDLLRTGGDALSETQAMALDRIGVSARYMEGLIDDLLQLSRVGRTDADPRAVAVDTIVDDIAGDLLSRHEDVTIRTSTDAVVWMNPVRARQLFTNLIENAVRHGGRRPLAIRVERVDTGDRHVVLHVADDGVGIPADAHDKVFRIFQRLERFDAESEGSGIGLTMCKRIVEDVGGTISLADQPSGTTFVIELPTPPPDLRAATEPATTTRQEA